MIIAVTNQKGGVGKTTLAIHVAAELARQGVRTKLIDMDHQHSALDWSVQRDHMELEPLFDVEGYPRPTLHKHIKEKARGFDAIIIDVPPQVAELARSAIIAAEFVMIPVKPSPFDIWAARETVQLLREASIYREELEWAFVLNNHDSRTAIGREARAALDEYEDVPRMETVVHERVAMQYCIAQGQVAQEYDPSGKSAREIRWLTRELLERFESPAPRD